MNYDDRGFFRAHRFGDVVVDLDRYCVVKGGKSEKITPRAFEVLIYLIEHRERVVEKQELFGQIWKESFVSDNALTRMIKEIRRVIGDDADAPRYIETVPKRGYRFIGEVMAGKTPIAGLEKDFSDDNSYAVGSPPLPGDSRKGSAEAQSREHLASGYDALNRGAWQEARRQFEAALKRGETAEILEGLGLAAWWLDDSETTFSARNRAYLLYRERPDARGAARMATLIGWDCTTFRSDLAIANGWLHRAQRLLEGVPACAEHGWLWARQGYNALAYGNDPEKALPLAEEAAALGRSLGHVDLEMSAQSIQGLAMICAGNTTGGMELLDEVTAAMVAGEMRDLTAIGATACNLITGCERLRDYERAAEWCKHFKDFCQRVENRSLFAVCRTQYAEILMWRGDWREAENELADANKDLRPGLSAMALARLAKLRVRQGRLAEAQELLGFVEHYSIAKCVIMELALEQDNPQIAVETGERFFQALPVDNLIERANCLELLVRAYVAQGRRDASLEALHDLEAVAKQVKTRPLAASLSFSAGLAATLDNDFDSARRHFEDAVDAYFQCGAAFETGFARLELARALHALGRRADAAKTALRAYDELNQIKAILPAERAKKLADEALDFSRFFQT